MARPYSLDLRERVVAAVESGRTRDVASSFGVSSVERREVVAAYRRPGSAAALPYDGTGRRPFALAAHRGWVLSRLAEKPDLTLRALDGRSWRRAASWSATAVWHFLKGTRHHVQKKASRSRKTGSLTWPAGVRAGRSIRAGWRHRLVFIDADLGEDEHDSGAMANSRNGASVWPPRWPYGRSHADGFLAALRVDRIDAPLVRWADQRPRLHGLRRAIPGADLGVRATSSSWTISVPTRERPYAAPSAMSIRAPRSRLVRSLQDTRPS